MGKKEFMKEVKALFGPSYPPRRFKYVDGKHVEIAPYLSANVGEFAKLNPDYEEAEWEELWYNPLGKPCVCGSVSFIVKEGGSICGECGEKGDGRSN